MTDTRIHEQEIPRYVAPTEASVQAAHAGVQEVRLTNIFQIIFYIIFGAASRRVDSEGHTYWVRRQRIPVHLGNENVFDQESLERAVRNVQNIQEPQQNGPSLNTSGKISLNLASNYRYTRFGERVITADSAALPAHTYGKRTVRLVRDIEKENEWHKKDEIRFKAHCEYRRENPFGTIDDLGNHIKVDHFLGHITHISAKAAELSKTRNKDVHFDFNGKAIVVRPNSTPDDGEKQYEASFPPIKPPTAEEIKARKDLEHQKTQRFQAFMQTRPNFKDLDSVIKWLLDLNRAHYGSTAIERQQLMKEFADHGLTPDLAGAYPKREQVNQTNDVAGEISEKEIVYYDGIHPVTHTTKTNFEGKLEITDRETDEEWYVRVGREGYMKQVIGNALSWMKDYGDFHPSVGYSLYKLNAIDFNTGKVTFSKQLSEEIAAAESRGEL